MFSKASDSSKPIPVWGGLEATVNRVGDRFFDQFERSGHPARLDDLDRLAELGIKALRTPVLWERVSPDPARAADWAYPDAALGRLRDLRVEPIVGLVHHGSGPRHTNLLDPAFPQLLAEYARTVAERYPWVEAYTPVNEPLTTARFSALYGHWYPHTRDDRSFLTAVMVQVKATVLAMRAIREVNPRAALIQTDDLGKTHATPPLRYQAEFENERRWLAWDLLCGRVTKDHPIRWYFEQAGIDEAELAWHEENTLPPDVIGVNHYITSERLLDHQVENYPAEVVGGNGKHVYADVVAARAREEGCDGFECVLGEAWERYGIPVAITECHLGCTREEQMRWIADAWEAAHRVRDEGAQVAGFTIWSLFGAYDWCSLLTRWEGNYEPGVFDLRGPEPRPTALAEVVRQIAHGETPQHPILAARGWWEREIRLEHPCVVTGPRRGGPVPREIEGRPVLVVGGPEPIGRELAKACDVRGLAFVSASLPQVASAVRSSRPWAVVNTSSVGPIEEFEELAVRCKEAKVPLLHFSSDAVFDGTKGAAYLESDRPNPTTKRGEITQAIEGALRRWNARTLVVRASDLFGLEFPRSEINEAIFCIARGEPVGPGIDRLISPTYGPDLVRAALDLLIDGEVGVWHLANTGQACFSEVVCEIARAAGLGEPLFWGTSVARSTALGSERGLLLPDWKDAARRFAAECATRLRTARQFDLR